MASAGLRAPAGAEVACGLSLFRCHCRARPAPAARAALAAAASATPRRAPVSAAAAPSCSSSSQKGPPPPSSLLRLRLEGGGAAGALSHRRPLFRPAAAAAPSSATRPATKPAAAADAEAAEQRAAALSLAACLAAGALLGALVGPADPALPGWAQLPSSMLGWSYTACWTVSFWPQVIANHRRGTVDGLSLDYLALSAVGFAAYTAYTGSLYLSGGVRQAYEAAHGGAAVDVQLADVVFAVHALLVTGLTAAQAVPKKARTEGQRLSPFAAAACGAAMALVGGVWLSVRHTCAAAASAAGAAAAAAAVASAAPSVPEVAAVAAAADGAAAAAAADCAPLLDVVYALGAVKLSATLIKYAPQVATNHARRSTSGWALEAVLLDLAGGLLSLGQVGLDAAARGDWSVVTGNPAKLGIGAISLAFDVVFLLQHYVWYREKAGPEEATEALESVIGGGGAGGSGGGEPALALARAPRPPPRGSLAARRARA